MKGTIDLGKLGSEMLAGAIVSALQSIMKSYGIFIEGERKENKFCFSAFIAGKKVAWGEINFCTEEEVSTRK